MSNASSVKDSIEKITHLLYTKIVENIILKKIYFFFVVLFIICFRLDTLVPIPVKVPVEKNCPKPP